MVDVRGDVLRPPHGTIPAAVKSNKNQKWDPLRAMKTFIRMLLPYDVKVTLLSCVKGKSAFFDLFAVQTHYMLHKKHSILYDHSLLLLLFRVYCAINYKTIYPRRFFFLFVELKQQVSERLIKSDSVCCLSKYIHCMLIVGAWPWSDPV